MHKGLMAGFWVGVLLFSACSHTTTIVAKPADSRIYVDETFVGTGRARVDIPNSLMGPFQLRVESPDHGRLDASIPRFQVDWGVVGLVSLTAMMLDLASCGACAVGMQQSPTMGLLYMAPFTTLGFLSFLGYNWVATAPDAVFVDMREQSLRLNPSTQMEVELFWEKASPGSAAQAESPDQPATEDPAQVPAEVPAESSEAPPAKAADPAPVPSPPDIGFEEPFTY